MILYSETKEVFSKDVRTNNIDEKIHQIFQLKFGKKTSPAEVTSWRNSMMYMNQVLMDDEIPRDAMVSIEFRIPQTSKRIDFILSGLDEDKNHSIVIIELKQWSEATITSKDGIVVSYVGNAEREVSHPSYQAWTYAALLKEYNSVVQDKGVRLAPCAYLHNCSNGEAILDSFYSKHLEKAPLFLREDVENLASFIKKHVKYGDKSSIMYEIDGGKIRPSKHLADCLSSMLKGNSEFLMIDNQKLVFETAVELTKSSKAKDKKVLIVDGGPGSGKSVIAINLLVRFNELQLTTKYVTKNAAPRAVYERRLTSSHKKSFISNLFVGSGGFTETDANTFDVLIVDEAHRLNQKSGLFSNLGENQVKEIISSSLCSIFFIDESQKVTMKDIGTKDEIMKWAKKLKADVSTLGLTSQFRCNGSDGYLNWLDNFLQIKDTANYDFSGFNYEFLVFDNPIELQKEIYAKNKINNKARLVAGYCWDWKSKKNPKAYDIELENGFKMQWNLGSYGSSWIIEPDSVSEVGCIHTCQGLEVDYIGVIIGPDLVVRNGEIITNGLNRSSADQSLKGFKTLLKTNKDLALEEADTIIKNTYRTLMTRGAKGCYIYCADIETRNYFKAKLQA